MINFNGYNKMEELVKADYCLISYLTEIVEKRGRNYDYYVPYVFCAKITGFHPSHDPNVMIIEAYEILDMEEFLKDHDSGLSKECLELDENKVGYLAVDINRIGHTHGYSPIEFLENRNRPVE